MHSALHHLTCPFFFAPYFFHSIPSSPEPPFHFFRRSWVLSRYGTNARFRTNTASMPCYTLSPTFIPGLSMRAALLPNISTPLTLLLQSFAVHSDTPTDTPPPCNLLVVCTPVPRSTYAPGPSCSFVSLWCRYGFFFVTKIHYRLGLL